MKSSSNKFLQGLAYLRRPPLILVDDCLNCGVQFRPSDRYVLCDNCLPKQAISKEGLELARIVRLKNLEKRRSIAIKKKVKKCNTCGKVKNKKRFWFQTKSIDYKNQTCIDCCKKRQREWRKKAYSID